jgi:hypothetical protein
MSNHGTAHSFVLPIVQEIPQLPADLPGDGSW